MATTQTHHSVRHAISQSVADLLAERTNVTASHLRYTSIGTPSVGDGGAAATSEFKTVVDALVEILSNAVGDADFGGISPVFGNLPSSSASAPLAVGTGKSVSIQVANLLPFPSLKLRPVGGGGDVDISSFITGISYAKQTNPFTGVTGLVSVGTITFGGVSSALSGGYKIVVKNPLDTRTAEVVSTATVYFTAP